jgi:hypothetical protein
VATGKDGNGFPLMAGVPKILKENQAGIFKPQLVFHKLNGYR